jgi:cell volume regulation protein A
VSVVLGTAAGIAWIYVLERLGPESRSYMLTFAVLLGLYSLTQVLGGSGAVSVLLFGLAVGNREAILQTLSHRSADTADEARILGFHEEITFFIRTSYFLFLGVTFSTGAAGGWQVATRIPMLHGLDGTALLFAVGALLVFAALVASRYVVVRYVSAHGRPERRALFPVFGRGLGTAVLATLPFIHTAYKPGTSYHALFSPWEGVFTNTALLIILGTVLLSGVLVWRMDKGEASAG